jgi:hypothetical protein
MAFTSGTSLIKVTNLLTMTINSVTYSADRILNGVTFEDAQNTEIKVASGNSIPTSEKTTLTFEMLDCTDAEVTTLKALHNTAIDIVLNFDNAALDIITLNDVVLRVFKTIKTNDIFKISCSVEQSVYDVDTISIYST